MQDVGSSNNYRIAVDFRKNRIYFWFFGDIGRESGAENLLVHTRSACDVLIAGFTVLADFTQSNLLGLPDLAQEVQYSLMNSGVSKVASVWTKESSGKLIVDFAANEVAQGLYGQRRKVFFDRAEAEAWLDV